MDRRSRLSSEERLLGKSRVLLICLVVLAIVFSSSYAADQADQAERARLEYELRQATKALVDYCTSPPVWTYDNLRPTLLRAVAPFGTIFNPPKGPVIHLSPGGPRYRPIVGEMMYRYYFCLSRKERLAEFMARQEVSTAPPVRFPSPPSLADVDGEMRSIEHELDYARACYGRACGWAWPYINLRPLCKAEGFEPATILNPFVPVPTTRLSEANPDFKVIIATLAAWEPKIPNAIARAKDLRDDRTSAIASAASLEAAGRRAMPVDEINTPEDARLADMLDMYEQMKPALRQWRKDQHEIEAFAEPIYVAETELANLRVQVSILEKQIWVAEHDKNGQYRGPAVGLRGTLAAVLSQIAATERELAKIYYEITRLRQDQAALAGQIDALMEPWVHACDVLGRLGPEVHKASLPFLNQLIADEPRLWQLYLARSAARLHVGRHDEALADLGRVETKLRLYGSPPEPIAFAMAVQAHVLCKHGDHRGGMKRFTAAKRQHRQTWAICLIRGWSHLEHGKYSSARADFQLALKLSKKYPRAEVHEAMAFLLAACPDDQVRDAEEAVKQGTKACELTKNHNWVCLNTLASAYAEKGNFELAVTWATKALAAAPPESRPEIRKCIDLYHDKHTYRLTGPPGEPAKVTVRTWTDRTGKFHTEAIFVGMRDGKVSLKKKDDTVVSLPLDALSEEDKEYVRQETGGEENGPHCGQPSLSR